MSNVWFVFSSIAAIVALVLSLFFAQRVIQLGHERHSKGFHAHQLVGGVLCLALAGHVLTSNAGLMDAVVVSLTLAYLAHSLWRTDARFRQLLQGEPSRESSDTVVIARNAEAPANPPTDRLAA